MYSNLFPKYHDFEQKLAHACDHAHITLQWRSCACKLDRVIHLDLIITTLMISDWKNPAAALLLLNIFGFVLEAAAHYCCFELCETAEVIGPALGLCSYAVVVARL